MNQEQRENLVKEFCQFLVDKYGTAVDCNMHLPAQKEKWLTVEQEKNLDEADTQQSINFHAHIMMTARKYENNTFGKKSLFEISRKDAEAAGVGTQREQLINLRQVWEQIQNKHLEQCGIDQQVSCKSNAARGLDRVPEPKVPRVEIWKWKRGQGISDRMQDLLKVRKHNAKLKQLQQEKSMLERFLRQAPKPQPQLKPVQPIKTQPAAPLKPAEPQIITEYKNIPWIINQYQMAYDFAYDNGKTDKESAAYGYAFCKIAGRSDKEIFNMFYKILGGDPNSNDINFKAMEEISSIKRRGEDVYNRIKDDVNFVANNLKAIFNHHKQSMQQSQQNHVRADERPVDDIDNGNSMRM